MTLALAFLGGLVSCLSPCVLPVLPVFTTFVVGGERIENGRGAAGRLRAAGFLLGFAGVFVLLWVSLGLVGFALFDVVPGLRVVAGVALIALGVATAVGWQPMLALGRLGSSGSFGGALLLGGGVAIGWTPCIGPTLGAILTLAAASPSVWSGAALLIAYALGMTVPFVLVAAGIGRAGWISSFLGRHHTRFRIVSGGLIVAVGLLVATNAFGRLASLVPWGF